MIGTPIQCTLWSVEYRYRDPAHTPRPELPGRRGALLVAQLPPDTAWRTGKILVTTADPTGADLYDVTRDVVARLDGVLVEDFAVTSVSRISDLLRGLAVATGAVGNA